MVDLQHRLGRDFAEHGARSIDQGAGVRRLSSNCCVSKTESSRTRDGFASARDGRAPRSVRFAQFAVTLPKFSCIYIEPAYLGCSAISGPAPSVGLEFFPGSRSSPSLSDQNDEGRVLPCTSEEQWIFDSLVLSSLARLVSPKAF